MARNARIIRKAYWALWLLVGLAALPAAALASEVYINGVKVTGLKGQVLKHCAVRFDAGGNIHITATGYTVQKVPPAGTAATPVPATAAPPLQHKYFLVSQASPGGSAQVDIDVYLGGKWIRKVRSSEGQVIEDVSRYLAPGKAVVHFAASKNYGGKPRLSSSGEHFLKVLIGTGNTTGGTVTISTTLASFSVAADKTHSFGQSFSFTVR